MDYLVDFTLTVPEGTPASLYEQRSTGEGTRVAELAAQGHALRVWRPLPDDGRSRAIGLYRAADAAELEAILESLPLRPWMEISVTALAEHPNDPALSSARAPCPPSRCVPPSSPPAVVGLAPRPRTPPQPRHHRAKEPTMAALPAPKLRHAYALDAG